MIKAPNKLPEKLSELIEVALADLIKCERSAKYEIDMTVYHIKPGVIRKQCCVCFAGGVMAQSLGADPKNSIDIWDYPPLTTWKLRALDDIRKGHVTTALNSLDGDSPALSRRTDRPRHPLTRQIIAYRHNPGKFKRQMRVLARDLAAAGL